MNGAEFPADSVAATFTDGESAQIWAVRLQVEAGEMCIRHGASLLDRWPLGELRERRDQPRDDLLVLSRLASGLGRLTLTDPAAIAAIRRACPELGKSDTDAGQVRKVLLWAGGAIGAVLLIVFVIVPALAGQLAALVPPDRERALGEASIGQIQWVLAKFGQEPVRFCEQPAGAAALDVLVQRLGTHVTAPYPLLVRVIDHPMENAFAVPGGQIVVFDGLLQGAESPEEVAGVIGHEIGHVVHRDPLRLALRSAGTVGILGMVLGDFSGGALALVLTEQLINAAYAQDAETAADVFAYDLLAASGLPSTPLAGFFERMGKVAGEIDGPLSHLASHPQLRQRAEAARAANAAKPGFDPVLDPAGWAALRDICAASPNHG